MAKEDLFDILQKAWFLGPGLYKKGLPIPTSRQKHTEEYTPPPFGKVWKEERFGINTIATEVVEEN